MEDLKIKKERSELVLHRIIPDDTFSQLIDKINLNFDEVREYQGGRPGIRGEQGYNLCSGGLGSGIGIETEDIVNEFVNVDDAITACDDNEFSEQNDEITNSLYIINKYSGKTLLFSNLTEIDTDLYDISQTTDINDISAVTISPVLHDYKIKIYNSDKNGQGKHLHLLNTKRVLLNSDFFCQSGFTVSNDILDDTNTEYLRILGQYNSEIENHRHILQYEGNQIQLKRNQLAQTFKLDPGAPDENENSGRLQLQKQNKDNVFRISDRTGWVGIWEDVTNNLEIWEEFTNEEEKNIVFTKMRFNDGGGVINKTDPLEIPFEISDTDSFIRFKRLNNFVLIDFRIGIVKKVATDEIDFINSIVRLNLQTLKCRTATWHPSIFYEKGIDIDNDSIFSSYGFKIESFLDDTDIDPDNHFSGFDIHLRKDSNHDIFYEEELQKLFFAGQVWATIDDPELYCEPLEIIDDDACEALEIQNP